MNPTTPKKSPAKVAQAKMSNGTPGARKAPAAPAAYRPLDAPKVLQLKSSATIQLKPCKHGKNKKTCKDCLQSQQARNMNRFVEYQTPNKKTIDQDLEYVKSLNTNIAHGSKSNQYGQSGKTQTIIEDINNQRTNRRNKRNK